MTREQLLQQCAGPMLFSEAMYRAVVENRKRCTRRFAGPSEQFCDINGRGNAVFSSDGKTYREVKPKYRKGEIYYLPEPVMITRINEWGVARVRYLYEDTFLRVQLTAKDLERIENRKSPQFKPTTSRFMLKSFAREFVRVTAVRMERLQNISEADAETEGVFATLPSDMDPPFMASDAFAILWDSINDKDPAKCWDANPMVWVYEFERVEVAK